MMMGKIQELWQQKLLINNDKNKDNNDIQDYNPRDLRLKYGMPFYIYI